MPAVPAATSLVDALLAGVPGAGGGVPVVLAIVGGLLVGLIGLISLIGLLLITAGCGPPN